MQQDAMLATRCTATQPDNQAAGAQFARMTILSGQKFSAGKNVGGNQGLLPCSCCHRCRHENYCCSPEKPQPSKLAIMALIKLLMKLGVLK